MALSIKSLLVVEATIKFRGSDDRCCLIRVSWSMKLFYDYYVNSNETFKMLNVIKFKELLSRLMFIIHKKKFMSFSIV